MLLRRFTRLNIILGLSLLAGLAYLIYPFAVGERRMQAFCDSLSPGASQQSVEEAASREGFRLVVGKEQFGLVHDPGSFGRFICEVKFMDGRLTSARYYFND